MSERHDHDKNFSGKDRIKLGAKSFNLQVYDVWRRTTGDNPSTSELNVSNYLFPSPFTTGMFFELHSW